MVLGTSLMFAGAPSAAHATPPQPPRLLEANPEQASLIERDSGLPEQPRAEEPGEADMHSGHSMGEAMEEAEMHPMTFPLGLGMNREGSGTSWQPDLTPMRAEHFMPGSWMVMVHGIFFGGYDWAGSDRGSQRAVSTNWLMVMADHKLFSGNLMLRGMFSAEPLTVPGRGYPLLFQTGETFGGELLHDVQHPHDFFMELGASYSHELTSSVAFQLYAALSGEPALGPTAFPHRVSASSDPLAVLGHHWLDSSHVSFGVLTAGLFTRTAKLEASGFNGREPDEHRWDLELARPDSYAFRLSVNPAAAWSLQASYGHLAEPERSRPGISVNRITASATHTRPVGSEGAWSSTFAWGLNLEQGETGTHAFLLESNLELESRDTVFGRVEVNEKSGHDLVLEPDTEEVFRSTTLVLGYLRELPPLGPLSVGLGVRGSINFLPTGLTAAYGTQLPVGAMVFLRVQPSARIAGRALKD